MSRIARLGAALLVAAAAVACSSLIPPVPIGDLFGLDDVEVELSAAAPSGASLASGASPAALPPATVFSGTVSVQFDGDGLDVQVPGFVSVGGIEQDVSFDPSVAVRVAGEDATGILDDFQVTSGSIEMVVRRDGTTVGTIGGSTSYPGGLTFERNACEYDGTDTECSYEVSDADAIVLSATAASAQAILDALVAGGAFDLTGTVELTLAGDGLTGSAVIVVRLHVPGGRLTF